MNPDAGAAADHFASGHVTVPLSGEPEGRPRGSPERPRVGTPADQGPALFSSQTRSASANGCKWTYMPSTPFIIR